MPYATPEEIQEQALANQRAVESSNNKHLIGQPDMRPGSSSYGQRAGGSAQIMPNTAYSILQHGTPEQLQQLKQLMQVKGDVVQNPMDVTNYLATHPQQDQALQHQMMQNLYNKTGGDMEKMNYMWNQGENTPVNKITPQVLNNSSYMQKIRNANPQESADQQASNNISQEDNAKQNPSQITKTNQSSYGLGLDQINKIFDDYLKPEENSEEDKE